VWWLGNEDIAITKFGSLLEAELVNQGLQVPTNYYNDKTAWEIVHVIAAHFRTLLQTRIQ
jgi:hypothetical protein